MYGAKKLGKDGRVTDSIGGAGQGAAGPGGAAHEHDGRGVGTADERRRGGFGGEPGFREGGRRRPDRVVPPGAAPGAAPRNAGSRSRARARAPTPRRDARRGRRRRRRRLLRCQRPRHHVQDGPLRRRSRAPSRRRRLRSRVRTNRRPGR